MSFLSSVLSKLTDPGGNNNKQISSEDYDLTCKDEVDDFMLVAEKEDRTNNASNAQNLPPTYYQVTGADNSTPRPVQPASDYLPNYADALSMTATGNAEVKTSPLDGVPFVLWGDHGSASETAQLFHQIDSCISRNFSPADINVKYMYTFESERTVLREYGDTSEDTYMYTEDVSGTSDSYCTNPSSEPSFSDIYNDFGIQPMQNPAISGTNNTNGSPSPEVGCLVDLT